jgi:hypothetical protein
MEKIRIGNDLQVLWGIYVGEGVDVRPYDLTGKNLKLYAKTGSKRFTVSKFTTEGNVIKWLFQGKAQKILGAYDLELVENEGLDDMHTVDECRAFALVKCSCATGGDAESCVTLVSLQLSSRISVGFPSAGIEVDNVLSDTSTNPVQNKVVTAALSGKQEILKSGINIKTINGESLLGEGNIIISGSGPSSVPTKLSELENDVGYMTKNQTDEFYADKMAVNTLSKKVDDLDEKVSDFENNEIAWVEVK